MIFNNIGKKACPFCKCLSVKAAFLVFIRRNMGGSIPALFACAAYGLAKIKHGREVAVVSDESVKLAFLHIKYFADSKCIIGCKNLVAHFA